MAVNGERARDAATKLSLQPQDELTPAHVAAAVRRLDLSKNTVVRSLPDGLVCREILARDSAIAAIGENVRCRELVLDGSAIEHIPNSARIEHRLSARNCQRLKSLPAGLRTGVVDLRDCLALEELPRRLSAAFLDLAGCTALTALPDDLELRGGRLDIRDCARVNALPTQANSVAQLDISGCLQIVEIPPALHVTSWIDIGGSGVTARPPHLAGIGLRWRGVPIDDRIAFRPRELGVGEILEQRNAEVRRVMLERYGFETFMAAADAELLDRDRDPGGERKLLRVELERDEPLVCVSVACPSTGRRYFLRVPPQMRTCRQAIAWTAGFENPDDYAPNVET